MFSRKLAALEHHSIDDFDCQNETAFRQLVSWLENQKIRFYTVEDRVGLDSIDDDVRWPSAFEKYLSDLHLDEGLSASTTRREELVDYLLAYALRLEYSDNIAKYKMSANQEAFQQQNLQDQTNPLENVDTNSAEFREGMAQLQRLLDVPSKANDQTSVLQAVSKLISDRLNPTTVQEAISRSNTVVSSKTVQPNPSCVVNLTLDSVNLGIDLSTNDPVVERAAKILRLLHIRELRELQTRINETIVSIQTVTANPKTDSSLGRVGR